MMKAISLLLIVAIAIAGAGCDLFKTKESVPEPVPPAPEENAASPEPVAEETEEVAEPVVEIESESETALPPVLYQYDKVQEYQYRITTQVQGISQTSDIKVRIEPDTLEGKATWRTDTDVQAEGVTSTTSTWIDKVTYKCLKIATETEVMGQKYSNTIACPEVDPTQVEVDAETGEAKVTRVGTESVTVPAGTFTADKYVADDTNSSFWLGKNVPIPLKMSYESQGVSSEMVLVSYK